MYIIYFDKAEYPDWDETKADWVYCKVDDKEFLRNAKYSPHNHGYCFKTFTDARKALLELKQKKDFQGFFTHIVALKHYMK